MGTNPIMFIMKDAAGNIMYILVSFNITVNNLQNFNNI